jgi:hypothetical protein
MTIHAYTELTGYVSYPAYINISERVHDERDVIVTVRSSGESNGSSILMTKAQVRQMAEDILKSLDKGS